MKRFLFILLFIPILIFGQDRIKYIENKGQWNENSLYKTDLENGAAYFESNSVRFNFYDPTKIDHLHVNSSKAVSDIVDFYAYDLLFVNSNAGSNVLANNILGGYSNYFIGSDRRKWKNNVKAYKSITYLSLYDGIDCEFYSSGDFLKYDFIISPKHDPSLIKLKYSGVDVQKDRESILIDLGFNKIYESKPIAYQIIDGEKIDVECTYVLKNNIVSFDFPNGFDDNYNLIIDPVLITATLSGSMASDTWGHSATYDPMGNIYTGARCFSSGYPTTTGAYQLNYGGGYTDIAISKLDSSGSSLIWATYLGGSGDDFPHSLIVNSQNELCVYGSTSSSNYPTTVNSYDDTYNGGFDIIISHLDSLGGTLIGSTYLGGSADDGFNIITDNYGDEFRGEIMVDKYDNIFVASFSSSSNFPTTSGVYQPILSGGQDGVVLKINNNLSNLIWSTFIGSSSGHDAAYGIRVDDDYVYFTGSASDGFPVTSGSAITTYQGGSYDGFVAKLNNQGNTLVASSYFGSSSTDQSFFIDLDKDSSIYIYGQNGASISISSGCYGVPNSRQFITKFNNELSNNVWQTAIGSGSSSLDFVPTAFLVDVCNNIYISGHGGLNTIPSMYTTPNALYTSGSFYLMQLSPDAANVDFATHFTGNHVDGGTSRFDPSGVVYQAVCSCPSISGSGMTTTSNAYSSTHYAPCDIGVFKLDFETAPALAIASANPASGTAPLTIAFTNSGNGTSFFWDFDDNGATSTLRDPIHTYTNPGTYYVQLIAVDSSSCNIADTLILPVIVTSPPCLISLIDSSNISCYGGYDGFIEVQGTGSSGLFSYSLQVFNTTLNAWTEIAHSPLTGLYTSYPITFAVLHSDTFKVVMTDSLGCVDTLDVFLSEPSLISSTQPIVECENYIWNGSSYDSSGIYYDTLTAANGCDSVAILDLTINNLSSVLIDTACGQYSYNGIFYDSSGVYYDTLVSVDGCDSVIQLEITVFQDSSVTYITACDSALWNGVWYFNSTIVTDTGFVTTNTFGGATVTNSGKEGNIWYFGEYAGLDFNSGSPVALNNGQLLTQEGCASIADNNGDLLFYTDGMLVYNKNHVIMPNGTGLLGNNSSSQSAIIVKKPSSSTIYYIFTVDGWSGNYGGLNYSEVDMSLDGGLGDINANKNISLIPQTCEKVTAIEHQNGSDFWVVSRLENSNTFHSYLLTSSGVNLTPVITSIGPIYSNTGGYMKGSPDGTRLAIANWWVATEVEVYDFDNLNGTLSNLISVTAPGDIYGLEFSSNSNVLYLSRPGSIYQFNLLLGSQNAIQNSMVTLSSADNYALQLAPDNKIYVTSYSQSYLSVINNPDSLGFGCNFNLNAVSLAPGTYCRVGLPTFFSSIFNTPPAGCDSVATAIITINYTTFDTINIIATDNYLWSVNGINYNSSGVYSDISTDSLGCLYTQVLNLTINISGCTDPLALNYDPLATIDDGSCIDPCNIMLLDSSNITCFGFNDGYIQVHGSGVNNNFNYQLQVFDSLYMSWIAIGQSPISGIYTQNPVLFSNLYYGCYRIIMTDSILCNDTANICLTQPNIISVVANITHSSSSLINNGSIILTSVTGGTGSYTYSWNGPNSFTANTQDIFNLQSGLYTLVVTDDSLCSQSYIYFVDVEIPGCTDSTANNFNPLATIDDSSCCFLNFYNDNVTICYGDSIELLYSGSTNNVDSYLWSTGDTTSTLFVSPNITTTYWLTQFTNGLSCSDTVDINVACIDFSPTVSVSLSNLNCGLTDLTISVSQDSNEVDMDSAIFISDGGSFTISSMNIGDNIGTASMSFGNNTFNTNLIINSIPNTDQVIVEAINQITGLVFGTFTITNLVNGGVEIIAVSPGDGNNYTNGNISVINFINVFDSPNYGFVSFTSNITSELGDIDMQMFPFILNCTDFSPEVIVLLSDLNCGAIADLTITVSQDTFEVDMDTAIFTSDGGYFTLSSLVVGDNIGLASMNLSLSSFTADLIVSSIISSNEIIVDAIDQLTGANLGNFILRNLLGGGVEIIAVSPDDWNNFTLYGNLSTVTFDSIFVNSSSGLLTFTSTITSELGDIDVQTDAFYIGSISSFFTQFRCESYTWNGNTYDSTGIYVDTMTSIIGCDSIVTLNLTIYYKSYSYDTISVCDGLIWNGSYLDSNGVYLDTLANSNSNGCDSIIYLYLTINSNSSNNFITSCDDYVMNGVLYDSSGIYIDTLVNSYGCDSIVTLNLTINYSTSSSDTIISCDAYTWNGNTYNSSGSYNSLFINSVGCDSLATLILTINYSTSSLDTIISCDSYTWNGNTYASSGSYDSLFINSVGCDSLATLILTINDSSSSTINVTSCDSYLWDGVTYDSTGVYTNVYSDVNGCDSTVNLDLIINDSSSLIINITACGFYIWDGVTYNSTGLYSNLYSDINGCDSMVTIDLIVNNITSVFDTVTVCDTLFWNGNIYTVSGNYVDTVLGNLGCDSIVNLNLTVNSSTSSTNFVTACDSYLWNGQILINSGVYDTILSNIVGCDSFTEIYLTIIPTVYNTVNIHSCGSFIWNSNLYDSTGIYFDTLTAISGCDSVVSLDLIITPVIEISSSIINIDCYGNSTGVIDLNIVNGSSPFLYQWSNGEVSQDINNLFGDSIYSCNITDSAGCILDTSFYISQPTELDVTENAINVSCFGGNDGSISLNIFGGTPVYSVNWGSLDTLNIYAGFYSYIVTDDNGCIYFDSVEVSQPNPIQINVAELDISCFGYNDGSIEVSVVPGSGVPAYSYEWIGPNLFSSNFSNIYNLFAGDYFLTITDANNCEFDTIITLTEPANLPQNTNIQISNYSGFNIRCRGDNSGWVSVLVTGGYEPYTYLWSNLSTSDSIFNLSAGTYTLELTDSLGCVILYDFPLIEPAEYLSSSILTTTDYNGYNISCYSLNDGAIQGLANGGVPEYSYYWNSVQLTDSLSNLSAGEYELTVYDKNNCESTTSVILTQPDSLYLNIVSYTDTCSKGVGRSEVTVFGGVSSFSYLWSNGLTSSIISNFSEGQYDIIVSDANLCEVSGSTEIFNLPSPIIDFVIYPDNQRLFDQLDDPIVFIDQTNGLWQDIVSWTWNFDDGSFGSDSIAFHSYDDVGTYMIMLTTVSEYNCIDTLTKMLLITDYNIYIPNAFTPFSTNDQLNEIFKAYGYGIKVFKMEIYSRWGERIFTSNSIDEGWDGTSEEGNQVPVGIYIYNIETENIYGEEFKYQGQVKLIR